MTRGPLSSLRQVARNQAGGTAVEFAILFSLLLALTFGVVEVSLMLEQWNAAGKATQLGVRRAVVSTPIAPDLTAWDGTGGTSQFGASCQDPVTGAFNPDCDFPPVVCTSAGCSGFGFSPDAFAAIVDVMRRMEPRIQPENVQIEYRFAGLGFVGRPGGLPMAVTVRTTGMTFEHIILDALLGLPNQIAMPDFAATLVGEDLSSLPPP